MKRGGALISAVSEPDAALAESHGVAAKFFLVDVTTMHLTRLAEMIDAGELIPSRVTALPLAGARTAHEMLDGLRLRPPGKVVLEVGG